MASKSTEREAEIIVGPHGDDDLRNERLTMNLER